MGRRNMKDHRLQETNRVLEGKGLGEMGKPSWGLMILGGDVY